MANEARAPNHHRVSTTIFSKRANTDSWSVLAVLTSSCLYSTCTYSRSTLNTTTKISPYVVGEFSVPGNLRPRGFNFTVCVTYDDVLILNAVHINPTSSVAALQTQDTGSTGAA